MCHLPQGGKHAFASADPLDACATCHPPVTARAYVHAPARDCYECHAPHGSDNRHLLVEPARTLCFGCHDEQPLMGNAVRHAPANIGGCTMCHDPHSADYPTILRSRGPALCAQCHDQFIAQLEGAAEIHAPVREDCTRCHNPHSGPQAKMLPRSGAALCTGCHTEIGTTARTAEVSHPPALDGRGCRNCHAPHASDVRPLLRKPQVELCTGCHDQPRAAGSRTLPSIKRLLADNDHWHGPIRDGNCAGCHRPHGGENARLLARGYPRALYTKFDADDYALCFGCHDRQMVLQPTTTSLTGFRDGARNLHYVHVNKAPRGRSCGVCHDVHASPNPKQLRDKLGYGEWDLPIDYQQHADGGSCRPGCHAQARYRRVPIDAPDAAPADATAANAGGPDASASDAGATAAGTADAGTADAGATDANTLDAGATDAGAADSGAQGAPR